MAKTRTRARKTDRPSWTIVFQRGPPNGILVPLQELATDSTALLGSIVHLRLRAGTSLNQSNGLYGLCCPGCTLSFPTCQGFSDCTLDHFILAFSAVDSPISYRCWVPYQTVIMAGILAAADLASLPVSSYAGHRLLSGRCERRFYGRQHCFKPPH